MENEKTLGAKLLSKASMIFATLWVAVGTILKAFGVWEIEENDIIYSAICIVGIWSPTYLSIWLDKIKDIRLGK